MRLLAAATLLILPGMWVSLGLRQTALRLSARLALAVVLSPFVVGIQFIGARTVGIGFEPAVWLVVAINLPALVLLARTTGPDWKAIEWRAVMIGTATIVAVAACAAIPWLADPNIRRFSFHSLIHTDVVYAFANGAIMPEDAELAGIALAYPWLGHAYWAVIDYAADLSPTLMYVITNLALVAASGVLIFAATRMLGGNRPISLGAAVLAALGPNLPGLVGWSVVPPNANGVWWAVAGDLRYTPFLLKFVQFEVMAFGIALVGAMVPVAVAAFMFKKRHEPVLAAVLAAAVATTYPILFPVAFALLAPILTAPYVTGRFRPAWTRLGGAAALLIGITVMAVLFLLLYTEGQVSQVVSISSLRAGAKKTVSAGLTFGPLLWLAQRAWRAADERSRRAQVVLLGGVLTGIALNIGLRIGSGLNEYKLVFGAGLCVVPLAAVGLQALLAGREKVAWAFPAVGVAALALVMGSYTVLRNPIAEMEPIAIDESSFWLRLRDHPDRTWTDAVRNNTPPGTLVIAYQSTIHTAPFTGRALMVPSETGEPRIGYGMGSSRYFLLEEKGYEQELYDARLRLLDRVYTDSPGDPEDVLDQLLSFDRPLAIVFRPGQQSRFRSWLEAGGVDKLLEDADGTAVYFIDPSGGVG